MSRVNLLLLIALILSSIYLIQVSHESRRLFSELDRARNEERLLDSEFERLRSEKQSQATPLRVEKTARDKLAMRNATPAVTLYLSVARQPSLALSSSSTSSSSTSSTSSLSSSTKTASATALPSVALGATR